MNSPATLIAESSGTLRDLYGKLSRPEPDASSRRDAGAFLAGQLRTVNDADIDLPDSPEQLERWSLRGNDRVGQDYQAYLQARKAGAPRQYFSCKAQALYFIGAVAPTKQVDGAWLFGLLHHWKDRRFAALIHTYLEELGDGQPDKNHVLLFDKLLREHECAQHDALPDHYYLQGTLQLAMGQQAEHFLPEIIGYNLGYEQPPLHLLITAHELNELGIDPYYFTLHITIDNADSGHASQARRAVLDNLPVIGDRERFYRRVRRGYALNSLGAGPQQICADFDLDQQVLRILQRKSRAGRHAHGDHCRVAGVPVSEWLVDEKRIADFLGALQKHGWLKPGEPAGNSRFWRLIEGERAEMFGVFNRYERQVIYDWLTRGSRTATEDDKAVSFRTRQRLWRRRSATAGKPAPASTTSISVDDGRVGRPADDIDQEGHLLKQSLAGLDEHGTLDALVPLLSPALHHSPAGLLATRLFRRHFSTHG